MAVRAGEAGTGRQRAQQGRRRLRFSLRTRRPPQARPLPSPAGGRGAGGEGANIEDTLLERLAALNNERAREEANGHILWLRPEFQAPETTTRSPDAAQRNPGALFPDSAATAPASGLRVAITTSPWPTTLPEQVAAVAAVLRTATAPLSEAEIAARFTAKGTWKKRLLPLLETLVALGRARRVGEGYLPE